MFSLLWKSAGGTEGSAPIAFLPHKAKSTPANVAAANSEDVEIDFWIVPARCMPRYAVTAYNLSDVELAHAKSLRHDSLRIRYLAVRSLLRVALSHSAKTVVENGAWDFRNNEFGKPELSGDERLSFSITHAGAFSVIAVSPHATIGIDAEKVEASRIKYMPFDCFSTDEQRHLRELPESQSHFDFFRLWTLKEAYSKALGLGFSAEFDRIEFGLDPIRLARKSPQAQSQDTESFDLASIVFDGEAYFLATCLLDAASPVGALKKTVFTFGS